MFPLSSVVGVLVVYTAPCASLSFILFWVFLYVMCKPTYTSKAVMLGVELWGSSLTIASIL